jgi:hypothetical protein
MGILPMNAVRRIVGVHADEAIALATLWWHTGRESFTRLLMSMHASTGVSSRPMGKMPVPRKDTQLARTIVA